MQDKNKLFSETAGVVAWQDAMNGDIQTLRGFLPWIVVRIERGEALEPFEREWLGNALMDMSYGVEPNDAFLPKGKTKGGQPRPKLWERWVAFEMFGLMRAGDAKKDAAAKVKEQAISNFDAGGWLSKLFSSREKINRGIDTYEGIYDTHEKWAQQAWGSKIHRLK